MSASTDIYTQLRETREQLSAPVPDIDALLRLLCLPLDLLDLLDDSLQRYSSPTRLPPNVKTTILLKWIPSFQSTILEHVVLNWYDALQQDGYLERTLVQYFVPASPSVQAAIVASSAYDVLLHALSRHGPDKQYHTLPDLTLDFILDTLARLSEQYSVDRLHTGIFGGGLLGEDERELMWDDCVRNLVGVPTRVANYLGGRKGRRVPEGLEGGAYFDRLSRSTERLISQTSKSSLSQREMTTSIESISLLLQKLLRIGLFPSDCKTQPYSFFGSTLSELKRRLLVPPDSEQAASTLSYSFFWQRLLGTLTTMDTQRVLRSFLSCLDIPSTVSGSDATKRTIKRLAYLLYRMFGSLSPIAGTGKERWDTVVGLAVSSTHASCNVGLARIVVCWASGLLNSAVVDGRAVMTLAQAVLEVWTDPTFIKHSLRAQHEYMTSLLLLAVSYLPPASEELVSLSRNVNFIQAVTTYMEHPDPAIRRLGLLAAEVLSAAASTNGKSLNFGAEVWDGVGEGREFCRELRSLLAARDGDAELVLETRTKEPTVESSSARPPIPVKETPSVSKANRSPDWDSDDDSLVGYDSPDDGSRPPSPTQEELDEIEKDPTLNNPKKKRTAKPVYLADLGAMFQDSKDPDKLEVALSSAEELIRRKKNYGTELEENAVNLVHAAVGLQDDFSLPGFDEKRQAMLNALIACCPQKAAPAIIEQFFNHQYSVAQRSAMLTALAQGARELAGLGEPPKAIAFPSKQLPAAKHAKLLALGNGTTVMHQTIEGIANLVIDKQASNAETQVPAIARERQLRVRKTNRPVMDVNAPLARPTATSFKEVAAEYFIMPFVNRFWQYLRDEQAREERTAYSSSRYRGAGSGMILSPLMLGQFLATLGVLVDAARFAPTYLAIIAPEVLELAVTLGSRMVTAAQPADAQAKQQADAVAYAAQVALIILDTSSELDGGRTLAMEHAQLVFGVGEWAKAIFENEEKGVRLEGAGSVGGSNLERISASLLLKVHNILDKWRGSMISGM